MAGAPHHTVLSKAVGVEVVADHAIDATALGVPHRPGWTRRHRIDDGTTTRSFQRELRWNAAYHRLAEGF